MARTDIGKTAVKTVYTCVCGRSNDADISESEVTLEQSAVDSHVAVVAACFYSDIQTRSAADADKPARRVYRSVKVIKHSIYRSIY